MHERMNELEVGLIHELPSTYPLMK